MSEQERDHASHIRAAELLLDYHEADRLTVVMDGDSDSKLTIAECPRGFLYVMARKLGTSDERVMIHVGGPAAFRALIEAAKRCLAEAERREAEDA